MAWTPRRVGDRITYSSTSTRQYKSAWRRWNQGRSIRGSLSFRGGSLATVRFPSTRSPVGYWETAVLLGSDGGGGDNLVPCPVLPFASGFRRVRALNYELTGSRYEYEARNPITGPQDIRERTFPASFSDPEGYWYSLSPGEYIGLEPIGFPPQNDFPTQDGLWLDGVISSYLHTTSGKKALGIYRADGTFRTSILAGPGRRLYVGTSTSSYRNADFVRQYVFYGNSTTTITFDLELIGFDNSPSRVSFGAHCSPFGVPAPGAGRPSCENSVGACTCPDFQKKQGAVMASTFASERRFRDWSSSAAGVASGEAPKWCKHIWSTVIQYCAGGNASRLEPPRNGSYPRPSRVSDSPYGAPSTDDLDWESWQADRMARRVPYEVNSQRWENFRGLDGYDRRQIRRHQRQMLAASTSIAAYERGLMTDMDYPYPNMLGADDYQRAFPTENAVFYQD
ncbi:MAG: hypothetical protein WBA57_21270 [Elainellaceae cyanobacterium]